MHPEEPANTPIEKSPEAAPTSKPEVNVNSIIENVEDQLEALKRAQEAQQETVNSLTMREKMLDERETDLESKSGAMEERSKEMTEAEASIRERESVVEERTAALAQRESDLEEIVETLDGAIAHATEKSEAVEKERAALEKERERFEAESADRSKSVESINAELESERNELSKVRTQLESASLERDSLRDECEKLQASAGQSTTALDELKQQLEDASRFADTARAEIAKRDQQLENAKKAVEQAQQASAATDAGAREKLESLTHERDELVQASSKQQKRISTLETEAEQYRTRLKEAESTPAAADARELAHLKAQLERAEEQVAESKSAVERRDKQIKTLQQEALSEKGAAGDEQIAELRGEVSRKDAQLVELGDKLSTLESELAEAKNTPAMSADSGAEIQKRDKAIEVLKEKLEQTLEKNKQLRTKLDARPQDSASTPAASPARVDPELRRTRLVRYKSLLRTQSTKLVRAKEALQQRHQECEQILAQREEVSLAGRELERKSKKVAAKAARNKASVTMLCLVLSVAICAVLSWKVAEHVAPSVYVLDTSLAIQPEGGGEDLEGADLETWGEYMIELSADARLAEIAAERMKRRGLLEFATPADLSAMLKENLDVSATAPGEITLSLRGDGAESTRRTLETYAAAMMTVANDARSRRLDGATTSLVKAPDASPKPVDSKRLVYAGAMWGASSGLVLAGFLFGWIVLAKAKKKFEAEEASATYASIG